MMWLYRFTAMNSTTSTEVGAHTLTRSLRDRSTSITCSARSFGSLIRSFWRSASSSGVAPRGREPAIGIGHHFPALDRDERLGAGSDDGEFRAALVLELEVVHVGARVEGPQNAVDVERTRGARDVESLRRHHLEHLAVADRLLAHVDDALVLPLGHAVAHRGLRGIVLERGEVAGRGGTKRRLHRVDAGDRVSVSALDAGFPGIAVHGVGDEPDAAIVVVDRREIGREEEDHVWHVDVARSVRGKRRLPLADDVPAEQADEPARERRKALDRLRSHLGEDLPKRVERAPRRSARAGRRPTSVRPSRSPSGSRASARRRTRTGRASRSGPPTRG